MLLLQDPLIQGVLRVERFGQGVVDIVEVVRVSLIFLKPDVAKRMVLQGSCIASAIENVCTLHPSCCNRDRHFRRLRFTVSMFSGSKIK
jgi:hypothetical protein